MAPRQLVWMECEKYGAHCGMDLDRTWPVDCEGILCLTEVVMLTEGQEGGGQKGHSQGMRDFAWGCVQDH